MVTHRQLAILGLCSLSWLNVYAAVSKPLPTSKPSEDEVITLPSEVDGSTQQEDKPKVVETQNMPSVYKGVGYEYDPGYFQQRGGMAPSFSGAIINDSFSLQSHHFGNDVPGIKHDYASAYATTSAKFGIAMAFATWDHKARKKQQHDGWVYEIQPTPNMINLGASGVGSRFRVMEREFAAMGGIRWEQVKRYVHIPKDIAPLFNYTAFEDLAKDYPNMTWTKNDQYNADYDRCGPGGAQPELLGDNIRPMGLRPPTTMTLEESAIEFMNKNGAAVGWNGTFPLDLHAKVDLSSGNYCNKDANP